MYAPIGGIGSYHLNSIVIINAYSKIGILAYTFAKDGVVAVLNINY